jgi:hypothetical protein
MDAALRDFLKQRHAFDTWSKEGASAVDFPRLELVLDGSELEGWQLHRSQRSKAAETVVIQSLWMRSEEELLAVDIQACTSRAAAHDALLEWLGEFQSPLIARQSPAPAMLPRDAGNGHPLRARQPGRAGAQRRTQVQPRAARSHLRTGDPQRGSEPRRQRTAET